MTLSQRFMGLVCNNYGGRKLLEIVKLFIRYNIDLKSTSNRTGWNALFALTLC